MFKKPASGVVFALDSVENKFNSLPEGGNIKKGICRAFEDLKENAFCGKNIPKKQIPKIYIQEHKIDNLWWYPLPDGWRLVYFITTPSKTELLAVILDFFTHKEYERKFNY